MPLVNYVEKSTPVVTAAWLNLVDALKFTIFGDAQTKADARAALTQELPLEVVNGGTGARTAGDAFTSLGIAEFLYTSPLVSTVPAGGATTLDPSSWTVFTLLAQGNLTVNIAAPRYPGQRIQVKVKNTSGGAISSSWGSGIKEAFVEPANAFNRTMELTHDGTNWCQTGGSPVDVPN